jgi:hypothetical protein
MQDDVCIHETETCGVRRRVVVNEQIPGIVFTAVTYFDYTPAERSSQDRVIRGFFKKAPRQFSRSIGAGICHANDFGAEITLVQFVENRLLT